MSIRRALRISLFGPIASLAILMCRWVYVHATDQDFFLDLTNYVVVFIPFAFSIFFAFVPDMRGKHIAWRIAVIAVGLGFSVVLWEQQHLASEAAKRDQKELVTSAVKQSNEHSDEKIGTMTSELDTQTTKLHERLDSLESHIDSSIGKVKPLPPPPPKFAQLQFSFYPSDTRRFPLLIQSLRPDSSGTFTMDFVVKNTSDAVAVQKADIWMVICTDCSFASEPLGFEKIESSGEYVRHKFFEYLNHGVSLEWKASVAVPVKFGSFETSFNYSCQTCEPGDQNIQTLTVSVIPPFTLSTPNPKSKARTLVKPRPALWP